MNYVTIEKASVANGTGVRVVLWCSGCNCKCKGCQNPETWDFNYGKPFDKQAYDALYDALNHDYVKGLTLSGGHPLEYDNLLEIYDIIQFVKTKFPTKDIWLYTGYTLKVFDFDTSVDVCWDNGLLRNHILTKCDYVVDGPYIEEQRDITLKFRGSSNQRIIDVKKTIKNKSITLMEEG